MYYYGKKRDQVAMPSPLFYNFNESKFNEDSYNETFFLKPALMPACTTLDLFLRTQSQQKKTLSEKRNIKKRILRETIARQRGNTRLVNNHLAVNFLLLPRLGTHQSFSQSQC